jgi:hypothetical protein
MRSETTMDPNWRVFMTPCAHKIDCIEAEIWHGNELWALIAECDDVILFLPRQTEGFWALKIAEVFNLLNELAKKESYEPVLVQAR